MKQLFKSWIFYAWLIMGTLVLTFVWGNYPYLFFYPPESFSSWLIDIYGSSNGEELADLELLYVFVCSFFITATVALLFFLLKRALTKRSSGR